MKSFVKYIIYVLPLLLFFFVFSECFLYQIGKKNFVKLNNDKAYLPFSYQLRKHPIIDNETTKCIKNTNCYGKYREPDGLNYKTTPIVIFGCSFAHGNRLKSNQTLSYKLSEQLKRPVYNRAFMGASPAEMYYQTMSNAFYEDVPPSDIVIYVMMGEHYRRILTYMDNPASVEMRISFKYNPIDKTLKYVDYNSNSLSKIFYKTYISKYYNSYKVNKMIKNPRNAEKLTDTMLAYFVQSRNELEKHWNKKVNFIVLLYVDNHINYNKLLENKLSQNGFKVINTSDLTKENLMSDKYLLKDGHPSEEAWNLLTPLIIKAAGL